MTLYGAIRPQLVEESGPIRIWMELRVWPEMVYDHERRRCKHHDDVMKWKQFPHYWPFVRKIHRSPLNSPHKGQWREALMFSLICAWINGWVNNREADDLRRHHAQYDALMWGLT